MKHPSDLHPGPRRQPRQRSRARHSLSRERALARGRVRAPIEWSEDPRRVHTMLKKISRPRLVEFWFAAVTYSVNNEKDGRP